MEIITRAEWGARPPDHVHRITIPTPKLYLHHAAGANLPGGDGLSDADLRRIRSIQNFHMDDRGWSDIAYSFLVDPDGFIFEGRGAGVAGGHTAGQNTVSHAICIMGNYDNQVPSDALLSRIAELVRHGAARLWWPNRITGGHRDAPDAATSCPGSKLYPMIGTINERVLEDDVPLTQAEINEIAAAVWRFPMQDATSGATSNAQALLRVSRDQTSQTLAKVSALQSGAASADEIVDEIADRLED